MYGFLLAILVLDGIFLGIVVLLQSGKGGGLAAMGGSGTMTQGLLGGRQATTVLTRSTWISGTVFMVLAFVLSIMSSRAQQAKSVIQVKPPASTTAAPAPLLPNASKSSATPATGGSAKAKAPSGAQGKAETKGKSGAKAPTGH